jgi:ABC-2 type transport system ATP-binding protein
VTDLTLTVPRGEVFGFLGPNGAGKSTAVKMLLGLVRPSGGQARVLGERPGRTSVLARLGFLPEHFRFHDVLTARELLRFHGRLHGMRGLQLDVRIDDLLARVDLLDAADRPVRGYSKGMLQRAGLAQALINDPALVFLDEPTSALDPIGRREVRDIIRTLKARGMTVFLNSHLLSEVETVCDRVAIVDHGRVVRYGPLEELLRESLEVEVTLGPHDETLLRRIEEFGVIEAREHGAHYQVRVRMDSLDDVHALVDTIARAGVPIYGVTPRRRSLEDVFLGAVEGGTE